MSYVTLAEANAINASKAAWDAASDTQKQDAIDYGRKYMDASYTCIEIDESDPALIPDDVKKANALLALAHLTTPLWSVEPTKTSVNSKSVDHGNGVKTSKSYAGAKVTVTDPHQEVTLLLKGFCILNMNKAIGTVRVVR